jgi:hypothetical protein
MVIKCRMVVMLAKYGRIFTSGKIRPIFLLNREIYGWEIILEELRFYCKAASERVR